MSKSDLSDRRKARVRLAIRKNAGGRPRLSVFRSSKQIYAQVIDDARGHTLVAASTRESELSGLDSRTNVDAARKVGEAIGRKAKAAGIDAVVFDTSGLKYHGRVAALAEAAREAGLEF